MSGKTKSEADGQRRWNHARGKHKSSTAKDPNKQVRKGARTAVRPEESHCRQHVAVSTAQCAAERDGGSRDRGREEGRWDTVKEGVRENAKKARV